MNTIEELLKAYAEGRKLKFLFFWGHRPASNGEISSSCFSQWWACGFKVEGIKYTSTEHWMMAKKARLFEDSEIEQRIINSMSPGEAKDLGRQVRNFDQEVWNQQRLRIVEEGNYHKFTQNPELKDFLLKTKNRILVEASPVDSIWGIGLSADHEFASVPPKWQGLNLLGFALMKVREQLMKENNG